MEVKSGELGGQSMSPFFEQELLEFRTLEEMDSQSAIFFVLITLDF